MGGAWKKRLLSLSKGLRQTGERGASSPAVAIPAGSCENPADSGRKICKEAMLLPKNQLRGRLCAADHDCSANGCGPLALSRFLRQEGQPDGRNARSVFWMPARQARPEIAGEPDVSLSRFCLPGWKAILLPQTSRWYELPRRSSDGRRHRSWRRCAAS